MGLEPISFFDISIREAKLIINGYIRKQKDTFYLQQTAAYNAFGSIMVGKKFKPINPFKEDNTPKVSSKEEKENTLNYLKDKFKNMI